MGALAIALALLIAAWPTLTHKLKPENVPLPHARPHASTVVSPKKPHIVIGGAGTKGVPTF